MEKYICPICEKSFFKYKDPRCKFRCCSRECYILFLKSPLNDSLKTSFKQGHLGYFKNKHLSTTHKIKLSLAHNKNSNKTMEKSANWKGGRVFRRGYIWVKINKHPTANSQGYIYEHRLVMEKKIGRYLLPTEIVHHINYDKKDNRPENLILCTDNAEHKKYHI